MKERRKSGRGNGRISLITLIVNMLLQAAVPVLRFPAANHDLLL